MPPRVLATSPGRKPRLWGPPRASCPFVHCWLQEFLDPLPKLRAGCPLEVPGEGFGSSGSTRFQLLERVFAGMQSPLRMGKLLPQALSSNYTAASQPHLLSCKSRSCTPGQGRSRAKSGTLVLYQQESTVDTQPWQEERVQSSRMHLTVRGTGRATGQRQLMWQLTLRVLGGRASAPSRPDCHRSCLLPLLYNSWQFQFHQESCRERKLPHESPSTAETLLVTTVVTACFHLSSVLYLGHSSRASQHSESDTGGHGGCWWWG